MAAVSIPAAAGTSITDVGFHDVVYRDSDGEGNVAFDGTDGPAALGGGALSWEVVGHYDEFGDREHNALRWGTTYNFRFEADRAPTTGSVSLVTYRSEIAFAVGGVDAGDAQHAHRHAQGAAPGAHRTLGIDPAQRAGCVGRGGACFVHPRAATVAVHAAGGTVDQRPGRRAARQHLEQTPGAGVWPPVGQVV